MPRKRSLRDDDKGRAAKCLRGLGIPQRQIAKVLQIFKENPAAAEEVGTAASTRRDLQWEVVHSCGHMLVSENIGLTDGSEFVWWYLDPCLLFVFVLENNTAVADVVVQRLFRSGGSMQLIYTADETFSGNPLHESGRKAWCVNFSIKEIPFAFRSQSAFWCCPAVCRTKTLKKIEGARLD